MIDDLSLLDAYWVVYATFVPLGLSDVDVTKMHALLDAEPQPPRTDGFTQADIDYLKQLGLTPEDIRRQQKSKKTP